MKKVARQENPLKVSLLALRRDIRKKYKAEFIKFLVYAHASCDETIVHLGFLKDTHNDTAPLVKPLLDSYEELGGKINRFINYVEKEWNLRKDF